MKKLLVIVLCVSMMLTVLPGVSMAAEPQIGDISGGTWGGIDWTFEVTQADGKGKLTIAPTTGEPVTNNGRSEAYEVGEWRENVKYNNGGVALDALPYNPAMVVELIIEEGVTSIGSFVAQKMPATGELVIPSTVRYIGQEAFHSCKFTTLTFAMREENGELVSDLRCLAPGAFKKLPIDAVNLPEGLECIHCWVFEDCAQLEHVSIPSTVKLMSDWTHVEYNGLENYYGSGHANNHAKNVFARNYAMQSVEFGSETAKAAYNAGTQGVAFSAYTDSLHCYTEAGLQDAIDAAAEIGGTVTLTSNVSVAANKTLVIPEGVTLDLNGKTLTNNGAILNSGRILGTVSGGGSVTPAYTLRFDLDGGSGTFPTIVEPEGADISALVSQLENPTKPGYTFGGWDKEIPTEMPGENYVIKAIWHPIVYIPVYTVDAPE